MNCRIYLFLLLFTSIFWIVEGFHEGQVCAEYSQEFAPKTNGIDASKNPSMLVYSSECKGCIATIKDKKFQTFCARENYDFGLHLCKSSKTLNCNDHTCCCFGEFCYDRLRNHFASKPAKSSSECVVQRKTSTESEIPEASFKRNSCSICVGEYRGNAIESRCIESDNLKSECLKATELIGGNLACTKDQKKCCCQSDDCQEQFEKLFFENGDLGKSLLSEPYGSPPTLAKIKNSAVVCNFKKFLFLLCFTTVYLLL